MLRITVHLRDEWLLIPCTDPSLHVCWLGSEAISRYTTSYPKREIQADSTFRIRRCVDGGLLSLEDPIKDVLQDNDFIELVIQGDQWMPKQMDLIKSKSVHMSTCLFSMLKWISLDGNSLTTGDLLGLGKGHFKIQLTTEAEKKVNEGRVLIESFIKKNQVVYGVNTGFGNFAQTRIPNDQLKELQDNVIRSHSAGVGAPLSPERTRMLLALRINVLAKGFSGVSMETLNAIVAAFNASCLSWVPEQGTVGASGDLAPLAHLVLGLMGEGVMWSPQSGWADARAVLEGHGLTPLILKPKEGLALINGTQMITALGVEAVERAQAIARQADIIAALTIQTLKGTPKAFDPDIHAVRPQQGQVEVAWRLRSVLHSDVFHSEISVKGGERVQDAYTLRCCPQVHGVANDTIAFVKKILTTELNSATDNPLVFAERGITISGGNFHGEYPAKALDFLAIGVHELANISERRIERLCNPSLSELPAFLVKNGGLNSGFMIAHCTAAALVSENKVLCHPSSVDSLSTSAGTEDHVSMGGWAARKALRVVQHVEQVLAIELLAACQALEFHRPLKTTPPLEKVYGLVRSVVRPWDRDRAMSPDIEAVHKLIQQEKVGVWCAFVKRISGCKLNFTKSELFPINSTLKYDSHSFTVDNKSFTCFGINVTCSYKKLYEANLKKNSKKI
uniref:Histidine ammonia-lyase n=1 Tax=Denticeps clupeoides TaxID=299321 RepID=A0AAY4BD52_9TELE